MCPGADVKRALVAYEGGITKLTVASWIEGK